MSNTAEETEAKLSSGSSAAAAVQPISAAPSNYSSDTNQNQSSEKGGLFDYLISRKKLHSNNNNTPPSPCDKNPRDRDERMKYHRLANAAAGSQYFGSLSIPLFQDDSDSDNDDTNSNQVATSTFAAASASSSSSAAASSSSWLKTFQTKSKSAESNPQLNSDTSAAAAAAIDQSSSSSSWMNKAWQTVDSATDWISSTSFKLPSNNNNSTTDTTNNSHSSNNSSSSWSLSSTVSNAISSIRINSHFHLPNPFKDDKESINDRYHNIHDNSALNNHNNQSNNANNSNNLLLLPKIASRFEWATKRRNPYQAVIGRVDTDYYLLSGPVSSLWGLSMMWLPTWFRSSVIGGGAYSYYESKRRND